MHTSAAVEGGLFVQFITLHRRFYLNSLNSKFLEALKMTKLCQIIVTPKGILTLENPEELTYSLLKLCESFLKDWREGLFLLAADKLSFVESPSLYFWQTFSQEYLTQISHIPEEEDFHPIDCPDYPNLVEWIYKAPPMKGSEYLSPITLKNIWNHLNEWVDARSKQMGDIHRFLQCHAPKWQQVGRVCFHLAENKNDKKHPFAFMATYSTGFNTQGKLKHLPLNKALQQYSGEKNRQALIKVLTPIKTAASNCLWVEDLVQSGDIFKPKAWSADKAHQFLTSIPELEESGLAVRVPNWWKKRARPTVSVQIDSGHQPNLSLGSMLNFDVKLALGDQELTEDEIERILSSKEKIVNIRGEWVELDNEKLQEALSHWEQVKKQAKNNQISFIEGMRLLAGAPSLLQGLYQQENNSDWIHVSATDTLLTTLNQLRDPSLIQEKCGMEKVNAQLRPYQKEGVNWLNLLTGLGLGACLADDMGLGKTLQILSLLTIKKELADSPASPSLLVVPASLLGNWKNESERFTPTLNLLLVHPSELETKCFKELSTNFESKLNGVDLVITTYSMLVRQQWLSNRLWNLVILDEAQAIKNSGTKQSRAARTLKSHSRIALTGTPIENRLSDLWSLFDFINPGLLGSFSRFKSFVKEMQESSVQYTPLKKLVSPYILRRMKTDPSILSDLPEKIETQAYCQLSKKQVQLYHSTVERLKSSLESVEKEKRRGLVLQTLLQLKQICNHPSHYTGEENYELNESGKFQRLQMICEELSERQEKVLIFTQFKEIISPIAEHLSKVFGRSGLVLHGGTPISKRKHLVNEFQSDQGPPFFILSLKAGGTGLTLTAASHVIHFDRWWNPAVENQATDRAFRIGQKKNVQVHKFITQGTIEEQIDHIIDSKKKLANEVLSTTEEIKLTELSDRELLDMVSLNIDKAQIY